MATIDELNQRFSIPGVAQISPGNGGLPRIGVTTPAAQLRSIYMARSLPPGVRRGLRRLSF